MNKPTATAIVVLLTGVTAAGRAQQPASPAEIPIEAFAQLPVMQGAELSPDGAHLAYIRPVNGRKHIIIQMLDGSTAKPTVVPPTENLDIDWLHWANDERVVFGVSRMGRRGLTETLETRLWAIDKDGSNAAHIVKPSRTMQTGSSLGRDLKTPQIQTNVIHWLPDEPNHILVVLDGDHNAANEVRRIDIRDGDFDIVRDDYNGVQDWLADQSGNVRIGWGFRNQRGYRILRKGTNGQWRSAEKAAWHDAGFFPQSFSESGDVAYMRGPDENGYMVVRTMDVTNDEFLETVLQVDGYDVDGMALDPVTRHPVGVYYTEHQQKIHYFDEVLDKLQRAIDKVQPTTVNEIVSMTRDRRRVLIRSSSDVDAGTYTYLNRDENTLSLVSEAMPGLSPELMSTVEPVSCEARDGLVIPAYLIVPRGRAREKLPLVVLPHGGPGSRDDKSFWFLSQFLASRGYAIFQPNFRGSTGYGRRFRLAGRREWGGKMQEDVTDGTQWLIDEGIADPERICIVGWSYGGYAAAMGAVQTPDLYQCAASINGVLNLPRLIADDRHYIGGTVWTRHMGLEDESAKVVSPYHQAEKIEVPMLIIQAKDDANVHLDQGKRMADRLRKLKKPVEYIEVGLGGHSMDNEAARHSILQALESFLAASLQSD